MFDRLDGPITKEFRQAAVQLTGIKWSKIYKYMFDQGAKLEINNRKQFLTASTSPVSARQNKLIKIFDVVKVRVR